MPRRGTKAAASAVARPAEAGGRESGSASQSQADGGIRTLDPRFTRAVLWPTELRRRERTSVAPANPVGPSAIGGGEIAQLAASHGMTIRGFEVQSLGAGTHLHVAHAKRARLLGLALRWRRPRAPLLIPRCRCVHTFGMLFRLDLVFLDERGRVIRIAPNIGPGRVIFEPRASGVIETEAGCSGNIQAMAEQHSNKFAAALDPRQPIYRDTLQRVLRVPALHRGRYRGHSGAALHRHGDHGICGRRGLRRRLRGLRARRDLRRRPTADEASGARRLGAHVGHDHGDHGRALLLPGRRSRRSRNPAPTRRDSRNPSADSARSSLTFSSSAWRTSSQRSAASRSRRGSRERARSARAGLAVGDEDRLRGVLRHADQVAERQRRSASATGRATPSAPGGRRASPTPRARARSPGARGPSARARVARRGRDREPLLLGRAPGLGSLQQRSPRLDRRSGVRPPAPPPRTTSTSPAPPRPRARPGTTPAPRSPAPAAHTRSPRPKARPRPPATPRSAPPATARSAPAGSATPRSRAPGPARPSAGSDARTRPAPPSVFKSRLATSSFMVSTRSSTNTRRDASKGVRVAADHHRLLDVIHAHHVGAARPHPGQIRMGSVGDAEADVVGIVGIEGEQLGGEGARHRSLAHAGRPVKEIRVRGLRRPARCPARFAPAGGPRFRRQHDAHADAPARAVSTSASTSA